MTVTDRAALSADQQKEAIAAEILACLIQYDPGATMKENSHSRFYVFRMSTGYLSTISIDSWGTTEPVWAINCRNDKSQHGADRCLTRDGVKGFNFEKVVSYLRDHAAEVQGKTEASNAIIATRQKFQDKLDEMRKKFPQIRGRMSISNHSTNDRVWIQVTFSRDVSEGEIERIAEIVAQVEEPDWHKERVRLAIEEGSICEMCRQPLPEKTGESTECAECRL